MREDCSCQTEKRGGDKKNRAYRVYLPKDKQGFDIFLVCFLSPPVCTTSLLFFIIWMNREKGIRLFQYKYEKTSFKYILTTAIFLR